MLRESVLSCSTVLLRRSILAGQRFPTEYYHEDYVFWLGLLKAGYRAIACTEVLADYRLVKGSRSSDKRNAAKNRWLIYRRVEKAVYLEIRSRFCSLCLPCAAEAQEGTMKVLLLSHNPVTTYNNMGKTFLSLFSAFRPEELCQLFLYPAVPDTACCGSYYRFTDREALHPSEPACRRRGDQPRSGVSR